MMEAQTKLRSIKYKAYRGCDNNYEEVLTQNRAEINLYRTHLEFILDITIRSKDPMDCGYRKFANLIRKDNLEISLSECWNENDKDKLPIPTVFLSSDIDGSIGINVETMDEASEIYNRIKNCMLQ